ncbi:MAG: hypothetical protein AB7O60_05195 [Variibacter sp.]
MHMILMLIGVAGAAAGGAMIAMGVLHQDMPLSPTWITSGTVAAVGGFVLIGLGAVVSRLRRMTDLLDRQPVASLALAEETIEPIAARPRGGAQRPASVPAPSVKPDAAPAEETVAVPPMDAPAAALESAAPPAKGEPSLVDKTRDLFEKPVEELPAPPQAPEVKPPLPEIKKPDARVSPESKAPEPKVDVPSAREWPRMSPNDRVPPLRGDAAPPIAPPIVPQPERPTPRVSAPEPRIPSHADPAPAPNRAAPTVLKSGVIEGMAYTLYSDGSIEAELAQGSMRFDSIPALRAYLRDIG